MKYLRQRQLLPKLLILLVGTAIGLVIAEFVVRLTTYDVHTPGMYAEDPDVGYVLAPNFSGYLSRPEFRMHFTTGQLGLRGGDPRSKRATTCRILVLGDSQAWGYGVADNETFSVYLEKLLAVEYPHADVQVLNGGVSGYGTADQLAFLQSRGPILRPDLVIVQFLSVNDFKENRVPARTWATVEDGMLGHRAVEMNPDDSYSYPGWVQVKGWLKRRSRAAQFAFDSAGYLAARLGLLARVDYLTGEDFTHEDAQQTIELLVQLSETSRRLEAKTLLMYTTGQTYVIQDNAELPRSATVVENAAEIAEVPWVNVTEFLRARNDKLDLYFPQNGHWTATGHRAIAELLTVEITEARLVPQNFGH